MIGWLKKLFGKRETRPQEQPAIWHGTGGGTAINYGDYYTGRGGRGGVSGPDDLDRENALAGGRGGVSSTRGDAL